VSTEPAAGQSLLLLSLLTALPIQAQTADFRRILLDTRVVPFDFTYTMRGESATEFSFPSFDNTLGVLEGVNVSLDAQTRMALTQTLYRSVPVGTRFAEGRGELAFDFSGLGLRLPRASLLRQVTLDCIPNPFGFCGAHTVGNSFTFADVASWASLGAYPAELLSSKVVAVSSSNDRLPGTLGDYSGTYRTTGNVTVKFAYDATTKAEYADNLARRALRTYMSTLGPGDAFEDHAYGRVLVAEVIKERESKSSFSGESLTQNQLIKHIEYQARGAAGAAMQRAGLSKLGDSGDIANDMANAFAPLSASLYVAMKITGQSLGVDYSEKGGGIASVARPGDAAYAIEGFLAGSAANSVNGAFNALYDLDLPLPPLKARPSQPGPTERQPGTNVPLRLGNDGPALPTQLFSTEINDTSSPVRFDPPNTGGTLFTATGSRMVAVSLLTPLGDPLAFDLEVEGRHFSVGLGETFDFRSHAFADGVAWFFVSGIDPGVPEFDALIQFTQTGSVMLAATDVTAVPEPAMWQLVLLGLVLVQWLRAKRLKRPL